MRLEVHDGGADALHGPDHRARIRIERLAVGTGEGLELRGRDHAADSWKS
jgi:hypothetical protein